MEKKSIEGRLLCPNQFFCSFFFVFTKHVNEILNCHGDENLFLFKEGGLCKTCDSWQKLNCVSYFLSTLRTTATYTTHEQAIVCF